MFSAFISNARAKKIFLPGGCDGTRREIPEVGYMGSHDGPNVLCDWIVAGKDTH